MVVGLVVAPHRVEGYSDPAWFAVYMYAVAAVLVVGGLTTVFLGRPVGFPKAFLSMTITAVLMLLVINSSLLLFDQSRSVKSLASVLRPQLQPGDVVATYNAYYQDLPVYLQRRITVVSWLGELGFGARNEDVSDWMIDEATFWQRWNGPATVYIVMDRERYEKLRARSEHKFYPVARTDFHVLLSNKEGPTDPHQGMARYGAAGFHFQNALPNGQELREESI